MKRETQCCGCQNNIVTNPNPYIMKKTTTLLLACLCTGYALLAQQPGSTGTKHAVTRVQGSKKGPDGRLLCDPNFIYTGSTSATGVFDFQIENPVPGYYYNWNFGDGDTATGLTATHSFAVPGSYTVSMESYNPEFFDTCRENVTICISEPSECAADFTWTGFTATPGIYQFRVPDPQSNISYSWDFGNGKYATGNETTFTYYTAGSYNVCLVAYDEELKDSCRRCISLCVTQVPVCWANFTITPVDNNRIYQFKAEYSEDLPVASYYWDFGDGNSSSDGPEVTHTYEQMGQYNVCLTITYENECSGGFCSTVVIRDPSTIDNLRRSLIASAAKEALHSNGTMARKTININPNPVTGREISIALDAASAGNYRYTVYNSMGEPVLSGAKSLATGIQRITLDAGSLRAGNYWIVLTGNKQQLRSGFIKL